ncbi:hypothetical protein ISN76_18985 [Dyella halodurans]
MRNDMVDWRCWMTVAALAIAVLISPAVLAQATENLDARQLSIKCVVEHPKEGDAMPVGVTRSSAKEASGKPCVGVATMLADGTVVFLLENQAPGHPLREIELHYAPSSVGYKGALDQMGGLKPGETKAIDPIPPSIGVASMSADGTLSLQLRMVSSGGAIGEGLEEIKPGDPGYESTVKHIGIKPGEVKRIPPWPAGPKN